MFIENEYIYYISNDDSVRLLYRMNINGEQKEIINNNVYSWNRFYVYNKKIIYSSGNSLFSLDIDSKQTVILAKDLAKPDFTLSPQGYIYYSKSDYSLKKVVYCRYDLNKNIEQMVKDEAIDTEYFLNGRIYYYKEDAIYVMNMDGGNETILN